MVSIGGHTVLHLASANRHREVVKRLVDAGARVNVRNAHGNTPLHSAAATGTSDVLSVSRLSRIERIVVVENVVAPRQMSRAEAVVSRGVFFRVLGSKMHHRDVSCTTQGQHSGVGVDSPCEPCGLSPPSLLLKRPHVQVRRGSSVAIFCRASTRFPKGQH